MQIFGFLKTPMFKLTCPDRVPVLKPDIFVNRCMICYIEILHDFRFCQMVAEPNLHNNMLQTWSSMLSRETVKKLVCQNAKVTLQKNCEKT